MVSEHHVEVLDKGIAGQYSEKFRFRKGSNPDSVTVTDESSGLTEPHVKNFLPYNDWIKIILLVIPLLVDPLVLYSPAISDHKSNFNWQLIVATFLLSMACMCVPLTFEGENGLFILLDFPFAETMIMDIILVEKLTGSELTNSTKILKLVFFIQSVARIIRIYSLFSRAIRSSSKLVEATWPRTAFNLFLYLQAANVFGGLWYFMSIERVNECWKKACMNHTGRIHCSFNETFLSELCPTKKPNTTIHDFGIFHGALESGIVEEGTNFLQKFLHCFVWGLQNLSYLGHNLQTSSDIQENIFVILVVSSGLMLLALLIGTLQTHMMSRTVRLKEMTKKPREIEEWEPFQRLSKDLQQQVKKYKSYIRRKTNNIDVESLLNNLPTELGRQIKRELCWPLLKKLKKVQECMMLKEETLDALCDCVKPAFFSDHTHILREGDPIDEMIFVVQGKIRTYTFKDIASGTMSSGNKRDDGNTTIEKDHLQDGDLYGEELVDWALGDRSSFAISKSTILALTNVEAFTLMADDLTNLFTEDVMNEAATVIQLT